LRVVQGRQIPQGWMRTQTGDLSRIATIGFRAQTREAGQTARVQWDAFRVVAEGERD
jgi:hypothetical protein